MTLPFQYLSFFGIISFASNAVIPTNSVDYWIGRLPPRCLIKIIYYKNMNSFSFTSAHNIPVMLLPLGYKSQEDVPWVVKFSVLFQKFLNPECFFSLMFYIKHPKISSESKHYQRMRHWLSAAFREKYQQFLKYSDTTFGLILHHDKTFHQHSLFESMFRKFLAGTDVGLMLVFLSEHDTQGYSVYCFQSPFLKHESITMSTGLPVLDPEYFSRCRYRENLVYLVTCHKKLRHYVHFISREVFRSIDKYVNITRNTSSSFDQTIMPRVNIGTKDFTNAYFPVFSETARLFTCHTDTGVNFQFFYTAFSVDVWVSILLSGILMSAFLGYFIHFHVKGIQNFSSLFFYFSIFAEESYSIPSKIANNRVYRIVTYIWLLTAVVLTNLYISHVISGLNAPLQGSKLSDISTLLDSTLRNNPVSFKEFNRHYNVTVFMKLSTKQRIKFYDSLLNRTPEMHLRPDVLKGFRILSKPLHLLDIGSNWKAWKHAHYPFFYSFLLDSLVTIGLCDLHKIQHSNYCRKLLVLVNPSSRHALTPIRHIRDWNQSIYLRSAIEEELVECQKTLYVETSDQLEFSYMSENYRKKKFYYLKDELGGYPTIWAFYHLQGTKIPLLFSYFLQSGAYHHEHKHFIRQEHFRRREVTSDIIRRNEKPSLLDLSSSMQTVFFVYIALVLLASFRFLSELFYSMLGRLLLECIYLRFLLCCCKMRCLFRQFKVVNIFLSKLLFESKY